MEVCSGSETCLVLKVKFNAFTMTPQWHLWDKEDKKKNMEIKKKWSWVLRLYLKECSTCQRQRRGCWDIFQTHQQALLLFVQFRKCGTILIGRANLEWTFMLSVWSTARSGRAHLPPAATVRGLVGHQNIPPSRSGFLYLLVTSSPCFLGLSALVHLPFPNHRPTISP